MNIAFENPQLEKRFKRFIENNHGKEVGGVLFYHFDQVADIHWKRHERLFGDKSVGLITDWLICPNVSNLPDREYSVSDLKQFIGIAEQTADTREVLFMHFHSHPNNNLSPSSNDLKHWFDWWPLYPQTQSYTRAAIVGKVGWDGELNMVCHNIEKHGDKTNIKQWNLLPWKYIRYRIRKDEKSKVKQP